jgi:hypothetical protein
VGTRIPVLLTAARSAFDAALRDACNTGAPRIISHSLREKTVELHVLSVESYHFTTLSVCVTTMSTMSIIRPSMLRGY